MPPLISFIVVVHDEQAYLRECADAALDGDVELIAIDDGASGHAPALLDELAAGDERVRVEHLGERIGTGAARDRALELASGEYVWLIDATDLPAPGAVAPRLRELAPDVLVVHHQVAPLVGPRRPGPHRRLLARVAERGPGTLDERPGMADAAPALFDKVLRRSLVRGLGVRCADGDVAVGWAALLAAERIAALPEPAYVRRRRDEPLDVFAAYDAVLALDAPEERRRLVGPAMLRHLLGLLPRVPERDRPGFFRRISAAARAAGVAAPGRYGTFRAAERARAGRRELGRRRAALTRRGREAALARHYRARLRRPLDPDLAVFAAYWYRGYACNPRAIYERARDLVPGMRGVWVVNRDAVDAIPAGVEHVVAGTREYYDVMARARYLVNNVNWPNDIVKREGSVHVMTHHGTPLKRMGLDLQDHPVTSRRMDFAKLLRRCARWDYSISQNAFSTLVWERVYPLGYESLEVGYPRNDVLATATDADVRRVRGQLGIEPGRTTVLVAPTHREYERGYRPIVDVAALADALGPSHLVLARQHYFYDADPQLDHPGVLDVRRHPSIEELSLAADVLVTDYSSLMFDYAVLDRPIVAHVPDWDVYRTVRGTYFDVTAEPPGPVTRTHDELVDALRTGARGDDARAAFRARFCSLDDGRAAERVVRRVWG